MVNTLEQVSKFRQSIDSSVSRGVYDINIDEDSVHFLFDASDDVNLASIGNICITIGEFLQRFDIQCYRCQTFWIPEGDDIYVDYLLHIIDYEDFIEKKLDQKLKTDKTYILLNIPLMNETEEIKIGGRPRLLSLESIEELYDDSDNNGNSDDNSDMTKSCLSDSESE